MRLAVFSDIHGNAVALDAVLADLAQRPADRFVCLGDAIQGGPQPAEVVARLVQLACPMVLGNGDDFLLKGAASLGEVVSPERQLKLNAVREWSLAHLSPADLEFIGSFQPTVEIDLGDGRALLCFHGSPASFNDIILPATPDVDVRKYLGAYLPRFMCGGHTHIQHLRRLDDSFYFNPGAVGLAYNHDQDERGFRANPWAEYAVLTAESNYLALEFRRVVYDRAAIIQAYAASGRPYAAEGIEQYQPRA